MAERRQPDYDFFGPGRRPATPPGGPPGPGYGPPPAQPYGTPPARPQQQPYGAPQQHSFAPPPLPVSPYAQPPRQAYHPVPRRSRAVTALIVVAVTVVGVIGLGVLAAIAIPVFLHQRTRAEWRATTVALPETFEGGQRIAAAPDLQPQTPLGMARMDVGNYRTDAGVRLFVVAAKALDPQSVEDQAEARRGLLAGLASQGTVLQEKDAGALGGWFGCGTVNSTPSTACVATDHGSVVAIIVSGSDDPAAEALRLREAVVRR